MTPERVPAARALRQARATRTPIAPLSDTTPGLDLAAAYRVQDELRRDAGPLTGWKLGLTSPAKQAQVGVAEPIRGFLPAAGALEPGDPLEVATLIQPRCEPEIAFVLGRDLAEPHASPADVVAATAGVAAAIEVIDSRYVDYRFTTPDVVADNASAARFLVGAPAPPDGIDLRHASPARRGRGGTHSRT